MRDITRQFTILLSILLISSCVTQKKKSDLSGLGQFYHNQTARFNAYYNADVLYNEAIFSLNNSHQDNYNQVLEIYPYASVDNADAVAGDMDLAIEKVTKAAKIHPGSEWTPDCYVMMGKAQFLKQDYESAQATLEFFKEEFDPDNPKNRVRRGDAKGRSVKAKKNRAKQRKKAAKEREKEREEAQKLREEEQKKREEERKEIQKKKKDLQKERKKAIKARKKRSKKNRSRGTKKRPERPEPVDESKSTDRVDSPDKPIKKPSEEEKPENDQTPEEPVEDEVLSSKEYNQNKKGEGIFGHKSPYSEGRIWLARTYTKRQKYSKADYLINQVLKDPRSYQDDITEAYVAKGELAIEREKYSEAIDALETAIERLKDRKRKARLKFIVGQLHLLNKNSSSASEAFAEVLKYKPHYDMDFNARINMLTSGMVSGRRNASEVLKDLEKMQKNENNLEYQDQILFSMAKIYLAQGNRDKALATLNEAISKSQGNTAQLAETHYLLAWLTYEDEDYIAAKENFDGAVANMNQNDPRYQEVRGMADNLEEIVVHIKNIQLQDSLLALSNLSDEEKRAFAERQMKNSGKDKKNVEEQAQPSQPVRPSLGRGPSSTFWAFKDEKEKDKQRKAFEKTWGDRQLTDQWRRSALSSQSNSVEEVEESQEEEESIVISDVDVERILSDVPSTEQEKAAARGSIMESMMELGRLYRLKIDQNEKTIEVLNSLLEKYPNSSQRLTAWFYLYLAHTDLGEGAEANTYKELIIENYPDSEYAKILSDPNYANKQKQLKQKLDNYYNTTYAFFKEGDYTSAEKMIVDSRVEFGVDNEYAAKFDLLQAMIAGSTQDVEKYIEALQDFIKKHPNTDEEVRAREIIRLLGGREDLGPGIAADLDLGDFELKDDKLHYIIILLYNPKTVSLEDAKVSIFEYNDSYHKLDKLRMTSISLNTTNDTPLILLRRFDNKADAMKYYDGVQRKKSRFLPSGADYDIFAINQKNYREITRQRSVTKYKAFFQKHYLEE